MPPLVAAVQKAEQQAVAAQAACDHAMEKLRAAKAALIGGSALALANVERMEFQLRRTASPLIGRFIDQLTQLYERERKQSAQTDLVQTGQFFKIRSARDGRA